MNLANGARCATIKTELVDMNETEKKMNLLDTSRLPRHVAIIMDGNGRWARQRAMQRFSSDLGIKYLTLYAFSTENWNRPRPEVDALMHLIGWTIRRETPDLVSNNVKIRLLGEIDRLPAEVRESLEEGCRATEHCTGLNLLICLSYSSRWELTHAAREIARRVADGSLNPDEIDENRFASFLSTAGIPDPDLLIRTGGEERISNFLLWQIAYSELYFTPVLWPDFDNDAYLDALLDFQNRERRFGMTSDQVNSKI